MKVVSIGPFPNPISGMSYINKSFFEAVKLRNKEIYKINTTFKSNKKNFTYIFLKPFFMFLKICRLIQIISYKKTIIYISLSASYGKIYDLFFILVSIFFSCRCIIHHHSTKYLVKYSILVKIISLITKNKSLHICLTKKMQFKFNKIYKIKNIIVLSNIFFLKKKNIKKRERSKLKRIGFLGNIIEKKGIFTFIKILKKLDFYNVRGVIAGPIIEKKNKIKKIIFETKNIKYLGKINSKSKENFFNQIDLLLFPSTLTEAEPLVILECTLRGIPVIAIKRGYINEILHNKRGFVFNENTYIKRTIKTIIAFIQKKLSLNYFSNVCLNQSDNMALVNQRKFNSIIKYINVN